MEIKLWGSSLSFRKEWSPVTTKLHPKDKERLDAFCKKHKVYREHLIRRLILDLLEERIKMRVSVAEYLDGTKKYAHQFED